MSLTFPIGDYGRCPNCNGVLPYHNHPCSGGAPVWPTWPWPVAPTLTEEDVRRIVRDELAKGPTGGGGNGQ